MQVAQSAIAQYHAMGGQPWRPTGYMTGTPGYGQFRLTSNTAVLGVFSTGTTNDFQAQSAPAHTTGFDPVAPALRGTSSNTAQGLFAPSSAPHSRIVHPRPPHYKESPLGFSFGHRLYSFEPLATPTPRGRGAQLYARVLEPKQKDTDEKEPGPSSAPVQSGPFGSQYQQTSTQNGQTVDLHGLFQQSQMEQYIGANQKRARENKGMRTAEGNANTRDKGKGKATGPLQGGWA